VTISWRKEIRDAAAQRFVRWVLNGVSIEIRHDLDPSWDHSGHARQYQADPLILLTRYETLQEWLDSEYTGDSTASFVSGMGLFWDTYADQIKREADERVFELLKSHLQAVLGYDEDDEDDDALMEIVDETVLVQESITKATLLQIGEMATSDVWQRYLPAVQRRIVEEQRKAEEQAAYRTVMQQRIQYFWAHHFPDIEGQRIEKPQFKELHLADRLRELLADADPEVVDAIAELGLPGPFSNSVRDEIQHLARQARL
jgi:hypothetical protein